MDLCGGGGGGGFNVFFIYSNMVASLEMPICPFMSPADLSLCGIDLQHSDSDLSAQCVRNRWEANLKGHHPKTALTQVSRAASVSLDWNYAAGMENYLPQKIMLIVHQA